MRMRWRRFIMSNKMYLVTGAAGFLGGTICRQLIDRGEKVQAFVLPNASIVTVNPDFNQKVIDVNVGGTENIIQLCLEHKECKKLVYCSSTGAIPELANGTILAGILEKQAKKKGTRLLMTTFSVYNLARNNVFDSSKAERELGYKTRSYKETIRDEVMWLKATGKIA